MQVGSPKQVGSPNLATSLPSLDAQYGPGVICCPICNSRDFIDEFISNGFPLQYCRCCQLRFLNPQPANELLQTIAQENAARLSSASSHTQRAHHYLDLLAAYSAPAQGQLLVIGEG